FQFWIEKKPVRRSVIELDRLQRAGDGMTNHARFQSEAASGEIRDIGVGIFSDYSEFATISQIDTHQSAFVGVQCRIDEQAFTIGIERGNKRAVHDFPGEERPFERHHYKITPRLSGPV